jgi:O-antigen chain-terminating methyltransferase
VSAERLEDLLARLERERQEADTLYNDALTALDQVCGGEPARPSPPAAYDARKLADVNRVWDLLPKGAPAPGTGLRGWVRALVWSMIGPIVEQQREFNASLVDHLNRNVAAHEDAQRGLTATVAAVVDEIDRRLRFQAHLIRYLQTMTLYVDTKDRSAAGGSHVLNAGLRAVTDEWMKRWESLAARELRFTARVDAVSAALDDLRTTATIAQQTSLSLKREVERVLAAGATAGTGESPQSVLSNASADLGSSQYLSFENAFRGAPEEIGRRLAAYVPRFAGLDEVLDIGCGRGEFLHLLREAGIRGRGLDINQSMVEETLARGLPAVRADALEYLASLADDSLGGIFAAQVIEHLEPAYLARLIETAAQKIRPGGLLVLETINPTCWVAFFESYIRDPTHVRPLHPETVQFLLRANGFAGVELQFSSPVAPSARLEPVADERLVTDPALADIVQRFNRNVELLNSRLFGYQDYAVIGHR